MTVTLRVPTDGDWPRILRCAEAAAPWAGDANRVWAANRRGFDGARFGRRHYVAIQSREIVGYGAIEGDGEGRWRMFVVMAPGRLRSGAGDAVFARLTDDLSGLGAKAAWMREEARDRALILFAKERGFSESQRFEFEGTEIVVLEGNLGTDADALRPPTSTIYLPGFGGPPR
jgi:hypothetical protein